MSITALECRMAGVMAILLGIGLLGCSGPAPTIPPKGTGDTKADKPVPADPVKPLPADPVKPQVPKLTAEDFDKEWQADKAGTAKKYAGGLVEITGRIDSFAIDVLGRPTAYIRCG